MKFTNTTITADVDAALLTPVIPRRCAEETVAFLCCREATDPSDRPRDDIRRSSRKGDPAGWLRFTVLALALLGLGLGCSRQNEVQHSAKPPAKNNSPVGGSPGDQGKPAASRSSNLVFTGPFTSAAGGAWLDVKADFGAAGDGVTDDTAAIRKAIAATGPLNPKEYRSVIYFPAGTYLITSTIEFPPVADGLQYHDKMVIGEDPATTRFLWGGPAGEDMWRMVAVHSHRFARLTFDGAGTCRMLMRCEYDAKIKLAASHSRTEDCHFKNAQWGIRASKLINQANSLNSEMSILRCRFIDLTEAGVQTDSGEAYDYWARACRFERCKYGLITTTGGDWKADDCVFIQSKVADMVAVGFRGCGISNCYSKGSDRFVIASGSALEIVNNTIIDPVQRDCITLDKMFSYLVWQNRVRSLPGDGPVVVEKSMVTQYGPDYSLSPGMVFDNTFTISAPVKLLQTNTLTDNNAVVPAASIDATEKALPKCPPKVSSVVYPIADAATAQTTIDDAVAYKNAHPDACVVVYQPNLSSGAKGRDRIGLKAPLVVPSNVEIHIEGDGGSSVWAWSGPAQSADSTVPYWVFRGPSIARIGQIGGGFGGAHPWGKFGPTYVFDNVDQPQSRIWLDSCRVDVNANGLSHTLVDCTECSSRKIHVTGPESTPGPSRLYFNMGTLAGGAGQDAVTVANGGRLHINRVWNESTDLDTRDKHALGHGVQHGEFVLRSSFCEQHSQPFPNKVCVLEATDFDGDVTCVSGLSIGSFKASGDASKLKYYSFMGHMEVHATSVRPKDVFYIEGVPAEISRLFAEFSDNPKNRPAQGISPNPPDWARLRAQLASSLAIRSPLFWADAPRGVTEVHMQRCNGEVTILPGVYK